MRSEWTKKKLSDIADFNPRETIKKVLLPKKYLWMYSDHFIEMFRIIPKNVFQVARSFAMAIQLWQELRLVWKTERQRRSQS